MRGPCLWLLTSTLPLVFLKVPEGMKVQKLHWSFRDMPHGHLRFLDNVVDGSHASVTHHNVICNRYTDPVPIRFNVERCSERRVRGGV